MTLKAQECGLAEVAAKDSVLSTNRVQKGQNAGPGALIVNADDWGRNRETTDRTLDCVRQGSVSSVSAMVFMEDSERAATMAQESNVDVGLHLNLSTALTGTKAPASLVEKQNRVASYLRLHPLARVVFHPGLTNCFEYVVRAQFEEFQTLYGEAPRRIDGHHHLHLCANVLFGNLLPAGMIVRRNFSFRPGEKSFVNRYYRGFIDARLQRSHKLVDFLFSLAPLEPADRLERIFAIARQSVVEVETHPVNPDEYQFLFEGGMACLPEGRPIASSFCILNLPETIPAAR